MYATQKANGLALAKQLLPGKLACLGFSVPLYEVMKVKDSAGLLPDRLQETLQKLTLAGVPNDILVRPAPLSPRHGFVESERLSATGETLLGEIQRIAQRVMKLEPDGELILMPFVEAETSAVLTSAGVTLGRGHDGATAGRNARFVPVVSDLRSYLQGHCGGELVSHYGIREDEDAYIEAVAAGGLVHVTQVRAGPRVEAARDYIPTDLTVRRVVQVQTADLLAWEQIVQALAGEPGVVVWHPGGSVCSHFGVHCVIHGIPYLTTTRPEVGGVLKATGGQPWGDAQYRQLAAYLHAFGSELGVDGESALTRHTVLAIATLHALPSLLRSREADAVRLVAFALAFLPRLFTGLCAGEARHARAQLSSYDDYLAGHDLLPGLSEARERHAIYEDALRLPLTACGETLAFCYGLFRASGWESEFGGDPWAACALASATFLDTIAAFLRDPSEASLRGALEQFNQVVHLAHNGGWWLNKVMTREGFDLLAEMPCFGFLGSATLTVLEAPLAAYAADGPIVGAVERARRAERRVLALLFPTEREPVGAWDAFGSCAAEEHAEAIDLQWMVKGNHLHLQVGAPESHPARNRAYGVALDVHPDTGHRGALVALFRHLAARHAVPPIKSLASERMTYGQGRLARRGERFVFTLEATLLAEASDLHRFAMPGGALRFDLPASALPELDVLFPLEETPCAHAA